MHLSQQLGRGLPLYSAPSIGQCWYYSMSTFNKEPSVILSLKSLGQPHEPANYDKLPHLSLYEIFPLVDIFFIIVSLRVLHMLPPTRYPYNKIEAKTKSNIFTQ